MKRVCLLTGASGTLGTAFCRAHADQYDIAAVYRTRVPEITSQLQRLVDPMDVTEPAENSHPIFAVRADLTQETELERVVELTLARFNRIDLVIHAAARTSMAPILGSRALLETTETQLRMNVVVPLRLASLIAEQFWKRDEAANRALNRSWINVSSIAGSKVYSGNGQSVYAASKAAMNMLTRHMADEFQAIGIRVNAIAPNTFPRIVAIDRVLRAIRELDEGAVTGKIQVLDRGASTLT
jgi:NAD(P)-dependent dehydrogenase (short-subunit alcohol dehydrogenase family)